MSNKEQTRQRQSLAAREEKQGTSPLAALRAALLLSLPLTFPLVLLPVVVSAAEVARAGGGGGGTATRIAAAAALVLLLLLPALPPPLLLLLLLLLLLKDDGDGVVATLMGVGQLPAPREVIALANTLSLPPLPQPRSRTAC
jgi:hypothetical protein